MSTPRRNTRCEKGTDSFPAARKRSSPAPSQQNPCQIRHPPRSGLSNRTFYCGTLHARAGARQSHPYARAMPARAAPDTLFGEPGGLCFTLAPNVPRLGQARRARQALVRKSESSTKCGDCGVESEGDAQVSDIRSEFKRGRWRATNWLPPRRVGKPILFRRCAGEGALSRGATGGLAHVVDMSQSRCGGDFPVILSETSRKNRRFYYPPPTNGP
jgi:hypothetical protein